MRLSDGTGDAGNSTPVSHPAQKMSIFPEEGRTPPEVDSMAEIISGPVVSSCARALVGLWNWPM